MRLRRLALPALALALLFSGTDPGLAQDAGSAEPELKIQRLTWTLPSRLPGTPSTSTCLRGTVRQSSNRSNE